jgi:hypothetical protein
MFMQQEVKTANTTEQDREQMRSVFLPAIKRKLIMYLPVAIISIGGIAFINLYDVRFDLDETKRGIGNVVFVFIAALSLRLAISEIMNYNKDLNNFQIKTAKGIIKEASTRSVTVGNYEFNLPDKNRETWKAGDQVELRASYKTNTVFLIQKV